MERSAEVEDASSSLGDGNNRTEREPPKKVNKRRIPQLHMMLSPVHGGLTTAGAQFAPTLSRSEVLYGEWVERIVGEARRLPGDGPLSRCFTAHLALLWLRWLPVRELAMVSATCRTLRGRASAAGAASIVEVCAASLCREIYTDLRPKLPRDRHVPLGAALLPKRRGTAPLSRPSWIGRLHALRRGATLFVEVDPCRRANRTSFVEVRVYEAVDGRSTELSRRPDTANFRTLLQAPFSCVACRGSLILIPKTHDPWFEEGNNSNAQQQQQQVHINNMLQQEAGEATSRPSAAETRSAARDGAETGLGAVCIRWDPSRSEWSRVRLWRRNATRELFGGALASRNFRRAVCLDSRSRLVLASVSHRDSPTRPANVGAASALGLGEIPADRRPWAVVRRNKLAAGVEEDDEEGDDAAAWTRLPDVEPKRPLFDLQLVSVKCSSWRPTKKHEEDDVIDLGREVDLELRAAKKAGIVEVAEDLPEDDMDDDEEEEDEAPRLTMRRRRRRTNNTWRAGLEDDFFDDQLTGREDEPPSAFDRRRMRDKQHHKQLALSVERQDVAEAQSWLVRRRRAYHAALQARKRRVGTEEEGEVDNRDLVFAVALEPWPAGTSTPTADGPTDDDDDDDDDPPILGGSAGSSGASSASAASIYALDEESASWVLVAMLPLERGCNQRPSAVGVLDSLVLVTSSQSALALDVDTLKWRIVHNGGPPNSAASKKKKLPMNMMMMPGVNTRPTLLMNSRRHHHLHRHHHHHHLAGGGVHTTSSSVSTAQSPLARDFSALALSPTLCFLSRCSVDENNETTNLSNLDDINFSRFHEFGLPWPFKSPHSCWSLELLPLPL